jgi:hypothetical protein
VLGSRDARITDVTTTPDIRIAKKSRRGSRESPCWRTASLIDACRAQALRRAVDTVSMRCTNERSLNVTRFPVGDSVDVLLATPHVQLRTLIESVHGPCGPWRSLNLSVTPGSGRFGIDAPRSPKIVRIGGHRTLGLRTKREVSGSQACPGGAYPGVGSPNEPDPGLP